MFHYVNAITDTKGNALIGYYVKAVTPATGEVADIYADESSTPIVSVSGLANAAKVDSNGNASFYIPGGEYHIDIYATDGATLVGRIESIPMVDVNLVANVAATRAAMSARSASDGEPCTVLEEGYEGLFVFDASDLSAKVTVDTAEGLYVAPDSDSTGASGAWVRKFVGPMAPEWFGAVGDGTTDDYTAFQAMIAMVNNLGGGCIQFGRGKTYKINRNVVSGNGITDFSFLSCSGLVLDGNGAKIDFKGDFDRSVSTTRGLTTYLDNCSGVVIRNLETDGNIDQMTNSSASAEAETYGLAIRSCTDVLIENSHIHHFSTDGILLRDSGSNGTNRLVCRRITLRNVRSLYNGRQGMSIVAARGVTSDNCTFSYTGRSTGTYGAHSPGGGIDIEPTRTTATASPDALDINTGDLEFRNCVFEENIGSQFLCGGAVAYDDIRLLGCRFKVGGGSTSGTDCMIVGCPGFIMRNCDVDIGQTDRILYIWPNAANVAGDMIFEGNRVSGDGALMRTNGAPTGRVMIENNIFTATGANAYAGNGVIYLNSGSNIRFRRNRVSIAKEMYVDGGSGDRHIINTLSIVESADNTFTTDLLAASGDSGTAHYANSYGNTTVVRNDTFTGVAVGAADTFRPIFNGTFDTTNPFNRNHAGSNALGVSTRGDQNTTFQATVLPWILKYNSALTATRTVSLDTSAGLVFRGAKCRVVRTAAATGAFNVDVGTGPLKSLTAASTWCEVEYDGSAWVLTAAGSL